VPDEGVRVEEFGDPGGRWVHLDAGQGQFANEGFWAKSEEQARPATGLEHAPAVKAHLAQSRPDGADHEFWREMCVLGRTRQAREILARHQALEFEAQVFPRGRKAFARPTEQLVSQVHSAEGCEFR
jgi:hypothetical protein